MADRLSLLLEAERRGLAIDETDRALLTEARRRGLVPGASDAPADGGGVMDFVRQIGGVIDPVGEMVTSRLAGERPRLEGAAAVARVAPAVAIPAAVATVPFAYPVAQGAASAVGEAAAQGFEREMGDRTGFSPLEIGVAGALPPAVAGVARTIRGLGRTAVRVVPSLFQKAQGRAAAAADDVAAQLTPETTAEQLFRSARGRAPAPKVAPREPIAALPAIGETSPTAYGPTGRYVARELTGREGVERTLEAASATARGEGYREGAGMVVAQSQGPSVAGRVMRRATPETAATATRTARETVPAGRLTAIIDDLDETIPAEPGNAALQQVRTFMGKLQGAVKDGKVDLDELMRQRLDLGREIARPGSAPELRALYGHGGKDAKGIIGALEEAAEKGGAGASAAREALTVFKRDLGVVKWKELVETAAPRKSISGVETPELNIAKLGKLVEKHADELTAQLGPEGMALIQGYLRKFSTLPPTHAYTAVNRLISVMGGGLGLGVGVSTGSIPIGLGAALLPEVATNIYAVGRNPVWVNQLMSTLAQATRAGVTPMVAPPTPVRVGPEARELAGGRR